MNPLYQVDLQSQCRGIHLNTARDTTFYSTTSMHSNRGKTRPDGVDALTGLGRSYTLTHSHPAIITHICGNKASNGSSEFVHPYRRRAASCDSRPRYWKCSSGRCSTTSWWIYHFYRVDRGHIGDRGLFCWI